jgi:hypothetical protein
VSVHITIKRRLVNPSGNKLIIIYGLFLALFFVAVLYTHTKESIHMNIQLIKSGVAALILSACCLGNVAQAELAYVTVGQNGDTLFGYQDQSNLWDGIGGANNGENDGGWSSTNRFFAADGVFYGVGNNSKLYSAQSLYELWNSEDLTSYGLSAVGWGLSQQYMAHEGRYLGVSGTSLYEASSALDLWSGNYSQTYGTIAGGWSSSNSYMYNSDGIFGVGNNSQLYRYLSPEDFDVANIEAGLGLSSVGYGLNQQFMSESDSGQSFDFYELTDVPLPTGLGLTSLILALGFRRKKEVGQP